MKKQIDWEKVASFKDALQEETMHKEKNVSPEKNTKKSKSLGVSQKESFSSNNGIIESATSSSTQPKGEDFIDLGDMGESIKVDKTIKSSTSNKEGFENKDNVVLSKQHYREKYNPKYAKSKFRPLNFLATMLATIAFAVLAVGIVGFIVMATISIFGNASVGSTLFNGNLFALSLGFSGFLGVVIYLILVAVVLLISVLAIPLFINAVKIIIYGFKVNNISNADYYKNLFVKKIIKFSIFNVLYSVIYIILTLMFSYKLFTYLCIAGTGAYVLVLIVIVISYFVNISRVKKSVSASELSKIEENAKEAAYYDKMHNIYYGKRMRRHRNYR